MALQKLAIAIFAYYAAITIQGCGGGDEGEKEDATASTKAPVTTTATTPAPTAAATPAPTPTPTVAAAEVVTGSLSFAMTPEEATSVADAFANDDTKAEVTAAFASSISAGIAGVEAADVAINDIIAARRLTIRSLGSHATGSLKVDYAITVPATVSDIGAAITSVDTATVTAAVQTGLRSIPVLATIEVASMETPTAPTTLSPCMAEFENINMEMMKGEMDGMKTTPGLCSGFEGFATHCKKSDWGALTAEEKDRTGGMSYDDALKTKDQRCSPCGKGWEMLKKKMDGGRRLGGHEGGQGGDSGPTKEQCDEMDKFIADCPNKADFDALEIQCGGDDHGANGGHSHSHHDRALGGHVATTTTTNEGSGYGYGYGVAETTPAPVSGCYGGPMCKAAYGAGLINSMHGCCDCTRFGPSEEECNAGAGVMWSDKCLGLCYDGPDVINGAAAEAGCYGGPACDEAFKAGNIGSKHGCCDCGEVTETECTAGAGVSWYAQCGTGLCLPDWRNPLMDSGPKCGDDGFEKYDNIKAALDEMKQGCGTA